MKKLFVLPLVAAAAMVSQSWATQCEDGGLLFCEFKSGCFKIDPEYDEGPACYPPDGKEKGSSENRNAATCNCNGVRAECQKDGAEFRGSSVPSQLEAAPWGGGLKCGDLGLTWTEKGANNPNYQSPGCCVYVKATATDGVECWALKDDVKADECINGNAGFNQGNGQGGLIPTCSDDGTCPAGIKKPENLVNCCYDPYGDDLGYCGAIPEAECNANFGTVVTSCSNYTTGDNCSSLVTPIIKTISHNATGYYLTPMQNAFNVQAIGTIVYTVYDMKGSILRTAKLEKGNHVVQFANSPRGLYMVKATSGSWKQTIKVIVK